MRIRRVRTRTPDYEAEEEKEVEVVEPEGFEEEVDDTPEIDQAVEAEPLETDEDVEDVEAGVPAAPGEDIGVDFAEDTELEAEAEDDGVPFIEDEDDEDFGDEDIEGLPGEGEDE